MNPTIRNRQEKLNTRGERNQMADALAAVRCPVCEQPLTARLGKHGPEFPCRCKKATQSQDRKAA